MYVVKFTIQTSMEETTIYRWLLTNVLYNSIYEDNQYTDFSNITLDIPININQTMLETTLVSNGTENSPFNKIGKNLATQTVTQTTKYTASVKEQVNFEQENNIPFNLLSCNITDINGQDVKTTLGINNCTIQQYLNGQVQYEVNIASEAYTGTTDALLPTKMSNNYGGYITLGFDPVNGWTASNNTNYQNFNGEDRQFFVMNVPDTTDDASDISILFEVKDGYVFSLRPDKWPKDEILMDPFFKVSANGKVTEYSPVMDPKEFREGMQNRIKFER